MGNDYFLFNTTVMRLFISHDCDTCGYTGEPKLCFRGPHIQQRCPGCDKHVTFIPKSKVPDYRELKSAIWKLTQDVPYLERVKLNTGFNENETGLELNLAYWRVYTTVRIDCGIDSVPELYND